MADHRKITKAVIPAAGFGTRMLPATKALPKEMLPVAAKPLIQYAIEEAAASGIETIILVTRSHKSVMQAHFSLDRDLESFLEGRQLTAAAELVRKLAGFSELRYVEQQMWDDIAKTDCDAGGEDKLTDALDLLCRERPLYGFLFGGQHYDAGDRIGYLKANIELTLRDLDLQDPLRGYLSQLVC